MRDIECSIVEADIQHYLESRLSAQAVQRAFPELGSSPRQLTTDQMKILVGMSGKLFIIARTASDFILDPRQVDPANRITSVIDGASPTTFSGSEHATIMDDIYLWIIRKPRFGFIWFRTFVGAIVLLQDPLPCESLAKLLGVDATRVKGILSNLHSLLSPGTGWLHLSHTPQIILRLYM